MNFYGKYIFVIKIFFFWQLIYGWRSYDIEFDTYRHEYNIDIVKNLDFELVKYNNRNVLNGTVTYSIDLDEFDVTGVLTSRKADGNPWTLLNITFKGCDFLEKARRKNLNLFNIILSDIRAKNKLFPKKCPIKKDQAILVKNFFIDSEKFPIYMPELYFDVRISLSRKKQMGFNLYLSGTTKQKSRKLKTE